MIHGHFLADSFDDLLPNRQLLTWVRHPVERLVSNYYHFLRAPDMRDDCCRELHERRLSLREFAELDWMRNLATRYMANKPVDDFQFVGITEQFQRSIQVFCSTYGFRNVMVFPRENTNPDRRRERYSLSPDDHAYILERNAVDYAWYNRALERLSDEAAGESSKIA